MKEIIQRNSIFLALSAVACIAGLIVILLTSKTDLHILLNIYHTPYLDEFMKYYSASVAFSPFIVAIALFLYRVRAGVFLAINILISTLIVQPLKHLLNVPRPITLFSQSYPNLQLPLVEGVKMNKWHSFPSGHTTTFFVVCFTINIYLIDYLINNDKLSSRTKKRLIVASNVITFFFAYLGGYSRIYLSQHFFEDITAGALIGCISTLITAWIVLHWKNSALWEKRLR